MKQAKEGRRGRRKKLLTTNICFVTGIYKWFSMVNTRRQTKFLFPWTNGSTMGLIGKRVSLRNSAVRSTGLKDVVNEREEHEI